LHGRNRGLPAVRAVATAVTTAAGCNDERAKTCTVVRADKSAFHIVELGTQVVDEVRRRVQQEQLGRRGHKDDPRYKSRGLLAARPGAPVRTPAHPSASRTDGR
jgi:hypothetical protein